jgi:hypothetical protein
VALNFGEKIAETYCDWPIQAKNQRIPSGISQSWGERTWRYDPYASEPNAKIRAPNNCLDIFL